VEITDPQTPAPTRPPVTRRRVLGGVVVAGAAVPVLAACGGGDDTSSTAPADDSAQKKPKDSTKDKPAKGADDNGGGSADALAKTSDIPVDGGKVFNAQKVVVTQPKQGDFKAFTAICTHMGCTVSKVQHGSIMCPCHGSKFSAADGSVQGGPATSPLAAKQIKVDGDSITLA
jgi:Rieske Fe-S protein